MLLLNGYSQFAYVNEDDILIELGSKFRVIRESKGLTQSELAAIVDKDQQSIQRFEKGRMNPSYIYMLEICKGLNISLSEILDGNFDESE